MVGRVLCSTLLNRAKNYALKMKLDQEKSKKGDQEKSKKGDQKVAKKEPKLIVEMLKFDQEEKKEEVTVKEQPFILKEVKILSNSIPWMTCFPLKGGFGKAATP